MQCFTALHTAFKATTLNIFNELAMNQQFIPKIKLLLRVLLQRHDRLRKQLRHISALQLSLVFISFAAYPVDSGEVMNVAGTLFEIVWCRKVLSQLIRIYAGTHGFNATISLVESLAYSQSLALKLKVQL